MMTYNLEQWNKGAGGRRRERKHRVFINHKDLYTFAISLLLDVFYLAASLSSEKNPFLHIFHLLEYFLEYKSQQRLQYWDSIENLDAIECAL